MRTRSRNIVARLTLVLMVITSVFNAEIASIIQKNFFARGGLTIGDSGLFVPGSPQTSISGILSEAYEFPPIRISLYRNEKVKLKKEKGLEGIRDDMRYGYPENLNASLYFVTGAVYDVMKRYPVSVAEATTSSKSLTTKSDSNMLSNVIRMGGRKQANGVYYSTIKSQGINTFRENWRSKANNLGGSLGSWSYILTRDSAVSEYKVDERMTEIFNPQRIDYNNTKDWTPAQAEEAKMRYLDMLLTLYTIAEGTHKQVWGQAVDDYLNSKNLEESPISICLDSAALMTFDNRKYLIIIPTIDFLKFYTGMETEYSINDPLWWGDSDEAKELRMQHRGVTYDQLLMCADKSVKNSPSFNRISNKFNRNNGFSFAASAFTKGRLMTNPMPSHFDNSKVMTKYLSIFRFSNPLYPATGYVFGYSLAIAPPNLNADLSVSLKAEPDNKVIESKTVGEPVTLDILSKVPTTEFGNWTSIAESARQSSTKEFDVTVSFQRGGAYVTREPNMDEHPLKFKWTPDELMEFIQGKKTIHAEDNVAEMTTKGRKEIKIGYIAVINIKHGAQEFTANAKDEASFKIVDNPPPPDEIPPETEPIIPYGYHSRPEAYSELKNYGKGSNMSGTLREDWEAMAGVPSTEQLYFAAGGSEFIVDVVVEKVEDEVAKRSYESRYTGTDCEFKEGDTAKMKTVPSPVGATSSQLNVDPHTGGTVTASWSYTVKNISVHSPLTGYNPGSPGSPCAGNGFNPGNPGDITWKDEWTADVYNDAVKNARAWQKAVNEFIIDHTSVSDAKLRKWNNWNASLTGNIWGESITTSQWASYTKTMGRYGYGSGYSAGGHGHGVSCPGHTSGDPPTTSYCSPHSCGSFTPATQTTVSKTGDKSFTITVSANVPAHVICGPCCSHKLPEIHDSWAQTWEYDSMKIADTHIWRIDQAAVNGLEEIISTDVVGAEIVRGRPNIFYNIALKNDPKFTEQDGKGKATGTSKAGRVRYDVEPIQHDEVIYNNGVRSNKCDGQSTTYGTNVLPAGGKGHDETYATGFIYNAFKPGTSTSGATRYHGQLDYPTNTGGFLQDKTDDKDKATIEYAKFLEQRETMVTPTMITDFLILQTSSGDQSVMYFHKTAPTPAKSEDEIEKMDVETEEMWHNNINSASKWEEDHINVGSYNGKYDKPAEKFKWENKGNEAETFFDPDPAGTIRRPTRPKNLMLYKGALNIILENINQSYLTGEAEVYWDSLFHYTDKDSVYGADAKDEFDKAMFPIDMTIGEITGYDFTAKGGKGGYILPAPYSKQHNEINDIIVHDPVSTEDLSLVSLPLERDQRTGTILGGAADANENINSKVCPREPELCDFRVLNCTYLQDSLMVDIDFNEPDGIPVNKVTKNSIILPSGFSVTGGQLNAKGTRLALPFSELKLQYQSSTRLKVEADIIMNQSTQDSMIFSFDSFGLYVPQGQQYATLNTGNGWERKIMIPIADGKKHHLEIEFSFSSVDNCIVKVDGKESYQRINQSNKLNSNVIGNSLYIGSWGNNNDYPANFILDNLKVTRLAGSKNHTADCYSLTMVHPNGLNTHKHSADCLDSVDYEPASKGSKEFNYTGGVQSWTAPATGKYTVELYGAQGGNAGARGSYAKQIIELTKGQSINVYVGGKGTEVSGYGAGWNGGGKNYNGYGGGGGATDIRVGGTSLNNRLMVAGGGAGKSHTGKAYETFNSSGVLGQGQNAIGHHGAGGGGGYYGGTGGTGCDGVAYSGSSYVDNSEKRTNYNNGSSVVQFGSRTGDGYAKISWDVPGNAKSGAQWFIDNYSNGNITESQAKDILGDAYEPIMANSYGNIIHTWSGWTSSSMKGFTGVSGVNLSANGNLVQVNVTSTPRISVPTDFDAKGITKIDVTLDNKTASTLAKLYWTRNDSNTISENKSVSVGMTPNKDNQVVSFVVRNNSEWKSVVNSLVFQLGNATGTINIKKIDVYGGGTKKSNGSENGNGSVVWERGSSGSYTYSATPGKYILEVWGAQGGNAEGGKGGYSYGEYKLDTSRDIHIVIGGQGVDSSGYSAGGYNGGGSSYAYGSGGGGATHMALSSGLLSSLSSKTSDILLVAGGGGGYAGRSGRYGGYGGGSVGGKGYSGCGGPGYGGTQTGPGSSGRNGTSASFGQGGNQTAGSGNGGAGGGGGYYGGGAGGNDYSNYYDNDDSGGGGGSGYVGNVQNGRLIGGDSSMPNPAGGVMTGKTGTGYARITSLFTPVSIKDNGGSNISVIDIKKHWDKIPDKLKNGRINPIWGCDRKPNIHVCDRACREISILKCDEPHHKGMHYESNSKVCWQPCNNDENHRKYKPTMDATDGTFTTGNFVNLDYGFKIYFPNRGDFEQGQQHGIGALERARGLGFVNNQDTTKWTRLKRVRFEFNVIYEGKLYKAGEWIILGDRGEYSGEPGSVYDETKWSNYGTKLYDDISKEYYEFYCVLANYEAKGATITGEVEAVNCPGYNDNHLTPTNRNRGVYSALHGGTNNVYADVVGRIGNLVIEDTGDYRFSNFFKKPLENTESNKPTIYGTTNGLSAVGTAKNDKGRIVIKDIKGGANVKNINMSKGYYRIDIVGKDLSNGRIKVDTSSANGSESQDLTNDKFLQVIGDSLTKKSYNLQVVSESLINISWLANNSKYMEVENINVTRLGDVGDKWIIDGVIREVDESQQNHYITWVKDIRGLEISNETNFINTYDTQNWMTEDKDGNGVPDATLVETPLSSEKNNISVLKNEPMLVGYPIYFDISTLGNYWWNNASKLQLVPYYYALDIKKKEVIPVDAYFKYDTKYQLVNKHGMVTPEWDGKGVYNYMIKLDWLGEKVRRNFSSMEGKFTNFFMTFYAENVENDLSFVGGYDDMIQDEAPKLTPRNLDVPGASEYVLGNAQLIQANGKARTFIGGETTYGKLMNLGGANNISVVNDLNSPDYGRKYNAEGRLENYLWWQSAQRWHLKVSLPSSTVFVRSGLEPDAKNVEEFNSDNYLILCTADMRAVGDTFVLKYEHKGDNGSIQGIKLPDNIPPVLGVYSPTKKSKYDIDIVGNH